MIGAILFTRKHVLAKWPILGEKHNWTLFAISAYSLARFGMEFLRGDDTFQLGPIRIGQLITLIIFAISARILYKRMRSTKPTKPNKK